eukprot:9473437-Pyramimonas_sp.AAC.1
MKDITEAGGEIEERAEDDDDEVDGVVDTIVPLLVTYRRRSPGCWSPGRDPAAPNQPAPLESARWGRSPASVTA